MPRRSSGSVKVFYPKWSKERLVEELRSRLPGLARRLPLARVILFGSYARGNFTARSDIDVLVVYSGPRRDGAYAVVRKTLDIVGLQPHVYSEDEYDDSRETIDRMTRGGVALFPSA